jgi:sialate O-acetylesterase
VVVSARDDLLRGLLSSWREAWKTPDLPFILIQLPRFKPGPHNDWPMIREKQFEVAAMDPFTGLVATIDLGDADDIHPRDKQPVADRAARMALALVYGLETTAGGPMLQNAERRGEDVRLTFSGTGEGLRLTRGDHPAGFSFETEAGVVVPVMAALDGPERIRLTLPPTETRLIAVRYAAEAVPDLNLINSLGLPAAPFRMPLPPAESPGPEATP